MSKQCPTCTAPVEVVNGDDRHFSYQAPRALDLSAVRLDTLNSFRRAVMARCRLRPALGFMRIFEDEYVAAKRLLLGGEEDERG